MADDNNSIPPRVEQLGQDVHTLKHRVQVIEDTQRDLPTRVLRLEEAIKDLPEIKEQLRNQGETMRGGFSGINSNFTIVKGMMMGAGAVWIVYQAGPEVLRFLGAR
jgi:hypothetical protein